jgi:hypothetical protein
VPASESSMWGDYHLLEASLDMQRSLDNRHYLSFFAIDRTCSGVRIDT